MADTSVPVRIKVCPECGIALVNLNIQAHALTHWPDYLDPAKSSKLARIRQAELLKGGVSPAEYDQAHKEG